jgi:seryl-tRNA synthetase
MPGARQRAHPPRRLPAAEARTRRRKTQSRRAGECSPATPTRSAASTLDLKLIRRDPEGVKAALARRGAAQQIDELNSLDFKRRELLPEIEERRARQRKASEEIAEAKRAGRDAAETIAAMRELAAETKKLEEELARVEERIEAVLPSVPNLPDPDVPPGETEEDAEVLREVGERPEHDFEPRDHLELGVELDLIDMEKAAFTSGARFAYLKRELVLVELALVQLAMRRLTERGFMPIVPPVLVREDALFWTGFLPTDRAQIYEIEGDDLFLVGTSEVSLAALHRDEILAEADLPIRYAGFSTCFRREAGAAGRDTRGIFRVHQFDKVEMYSFTHPERSKEEHERLLAIQEDILQALEIPYRVVNIAAGDLGASAAKKFDCEAWLPGQGRYREITSCSNTTDYQARRLRCRFRPEGDGSPRPVHTLNGTAVAVGRTLLAILENHQRADGSIGIPEVLHAFGTPREIRR